MRDVAEVAGVSLKTVSRVINDEPGVAAATADRVSRRSSELGFQRNDLARSLRQGVTSSTLGLRHRGRREPVLLGDRAGRRVRGARARLHAHHGVLRGGPGARARARPGAAAPAGRRAAARPRLARPRVPGARDRRRHADRVPRPPAVGPRRRLRAARQPRRRALGHRAPARPRPRADRGRRRPRRPVHRRGAARRLPRRRSRPPACRCATSCCGSAPTTSRRPRPSCASCSRSPPTAARPRSSPATTATRSARCARCAAPAQPIALVGFDDFELADLLGITVVRHDSPQMGANAAALAFERLDGGGRAPRRVVVPTELVVRGSGEVPPS